MARSDSVLGLDIGSRRIGVAIARDGVKLAVPFGVVVVDGSEIIKLSEIINEEQVKTCVVGLPRSQSGDESDQSQFTREMADGISKLDVEVVFQDESLTSVRAEAELNNRPVDKGDVDKLAATYILQDYLERYG